MKKVFFVLSFGCVGMVVGPALAVGPSTAAIPVKESAVVEKAVWLTSFETAKAEAAKHKVPILVDFSGSDWCGWCMKLDREVFSKPAFKDYAATNLVLLLVDFPRRKSVPDKLSKQNTMLAERYDVQGFPTVLLLDSEGKELARTGYQPGGAERYVEYLKSALQGK